MNASEFGQAARRCVVAAALSGVFVGAAWAQQPAAGAPPAPGAAQPAASAEDDADLRTLKLGLHADDMPDGYYEQSCGSNGGPPVRPINGWEDFKKCAPEANGLREVYVTFDDELAQLAKANPDLDLNWVNKFSGTVVAGFPVIASVLFDDDGIARGIRVVTDPRAGVDKRRQAYLLRYPIERRYGEEGWDCVDMPKLPGETAIGDTFIKRHCDKILPGKHLVMETRFYRKPGQTGFVQGQYTPGEYESSTRLEIWDPTVKIVPPPSPSPTPAAPPANRR